MFADNLKCFSRDPDLLLDAVSFTTEYVRLVGQEPAPSKRVLLSTSRDVRKSMKEWVLSLEGDKWSVRFDVRDLGGHLDTTFRGWSSTLAARVRLVISRLVLIFALPLDFHGRVRVVRSMYLAAALHGIEASFLASDSLRKLRSSIHRVVWSRRSVNGPKLQGPHAEDAMAKPYLVLTNFGDLITADHKVLSDNCESRNNHRYAVVVQDLATQWIQAYPCKNKTSQETQRSLQKFLEPERKPKVIHTDNSLEFGKACEDLSWNHCTSTPHRSETNDIAEKAVRRVKEGTSAVLLQSGLNESWWADSMECYTYLRNVADRSII